MSSYPRTLQRAFRRESFHGGRASKLGIPTNEKAKDFVARTRREASREMPF